MQQAIQTFEKQLKTKLEYKSSSKISPDTYMYKSFKFFDLYNTGSLNKSDFFKAIAKCGVVVDTHNLEAVYNNYADPNDGLVHYKEFIQRLLFSEQEEDSQQYSEMGNSQVYNPPQKHQEYSPMQKVDNYVAESRKSQQQQPTREKNVRQSRIEKIYQQCETYSEVVSFIKRSLRQRGITALLQFAVDLKSTDTTKTHKINRQKLKSRLPFLTDKAIDLIIAEFSHNNNEINYAELIYSLKGQLQPQQQHIIQKAFTLLDNTNEREVMIAKIVQLFRYDQLRDEFIRGIKLYETFQGIDDGVFTDEDFADFFGFLAFAFGDIGQFIAFVQKAYFDEEDARSQHSQRSNRSREFKPETSSSRHHIEDVEQGTKTDFRKNKEQPPRVQQQQQHKHETIQSLYQREHSQQHSRRSQSQADKKSSTTSVYIKQVEMIVLRIKKRLATRGTRGFLVFEKALKTVDTDEDGLIKLDQFRQVVKDLKIDITNSEMNLVFDVFDPDSTGLISFDEMVHTFKGNVPEKRNQLFERVWATVRLSEEQTTLTQIKHALNFRGHPDVQTGRKYDDEIWKEIQDTILLIQELNGMPRSQNVTKKQFYQYFENLSLTTSEDLLFESILQNFWKMQSNLNISEMYAGSRKLFDPASKSYLMDHHRYAVKGGTISSNAPFGTSSQPTNYFTEHSML